VVSGLRDVEGAVVDQIAEADYQQGFTWYAGRFESVDPCQTCDRLMNVTCIKTWWYIALHSAVSPKRTFAVKIIRPARSHYAEQRTTYRDRITVDHACMHTLLSSRVIVATHARLGSDFPMSLEVFRESPLY
jgi:hypothetical protein